VALLARGSDPPEPPGGADGAWPASRQAPSRGLARGDPPEPPLVSASRDCVAGGWALMA